MKRTLSFTSEEVISEEVTKKFASMHKSQDCISTNSTDCDPQSQSESCQSESDSSYESFESYSPSDLEMQVIRMTLAMICRTNMSDWDVDNSSVGREFMTMREFGLVYDNVKETDIPIEIQAQILYTFTKTQCEILYKLENDKFSCLTISWETSTRGTDIFTITKEITEVAYILFSRTYEAQFSIITRDVRHLSWCYFLDARRHLNRISPSLPPSFPSNL